MEADAQYPLMESLRYYPHNPELPESPEGGFLLVDESRRIVQVSQALCDMLGIFTPAQTLIGADCSQISDKLNALVIEPTDHILRERLTVTGEELRLRDGRTLERDYIPLYIDKKHPMHLWQYRDVTARRAHEEQLRHRAFHDPLTQLPNRACFLDRLEHALARASRRKHGVAVLYMDMDRYKLVNDDLGHGVGDELLVRVAGRLRGCLRSEDTAARLGGDEFGILLEEVAGEAEAKAITTRILERLRSIYVIDGRQIEITASIGIALAGLDGQTPEELLRAADLAMYRAKRAGRAHFEL